MLKEISIITFAVTVMGAGSLQAKESGNVNDNQLLQIISYEDKISKYDAKKISLCCLILRQYCLYTAEKI